MVGLGDGAPDGGPELVCPGLLTDVKVGLEAPSDVLFNSLEVIGS